jgi:hypothetical protein
MFKKSFYYVRNKSLFNAACPPPRAVFQGRRKAMKKDRDQRHGEKVKTEVVLAITSFPCNRVRSSALVETPVGGRYNRLAFAGAVRQRDLARSECGSERGFPTRRYESGSRI